MFFSGYLFVFSSVPQSTTGVSFVSSETFPASHTALKELLNLKGLILLGSLPFTETSNKRVFSAKLVFMQENQIAK